MAESDHGTRRHDHRNRSGAATGGDGAEWLGFNISELVGNDVDDVIDVIVNALCPPGGVPDDEAIRQGMDQALSNCMEIQEIFDPTALTQEMIADLLMEYLSEEVFLRIINLHNIGNNSGIIHSPYHIYFII